MTDFTELVDLASERLGGAVIAANDEFFAPKEAMLKATDPEWREDAYTERGKWMDGWETRRRREPGHDWAIIRLGVPGIVRGVVVDTRWFRGNYPEQCSVEACEVRGYPTLPELEAAEWAEILPASPLRGNAPNRFQVDGEQRWTHLRLRIHPDGGVARLRVHGDALPEFSSFVQDRGGEIDLAAMENGGWVMVCSDMFFGHRQNLILPGRSLFMGDGWETQRRRGAGHDWSIVRLAAPGAIHRVEIDTDHYMGNAPDRCSLEGIHATGAEAATLVSSGDWTTILPETKLQPHTRFRWEDEVAGAGPLTHVRLGIYPDGGIARMRLFGTLADPER